jgi:hypothetical protein
MTSDQFDKDDDQNWSQKLQDPQHREIPFMIYFKMDLKFI